MDQCKHYFEWGYTTEPVVYCIKCNKEIDELGIPTTILINHEVKEGKFVLESPIALEKQSGRAKKIIPFKLKYSNNAGIQHDIQPELGITFDADGQSSLYTRRQTGCFEGAANCAQLYRVCNVPINEKRKLVLTLK